MFEKMSKKFQQTDPYFVNDSMTKRVIQFFNSKPFGGAQNSCPFMQ